DFFILKNGLVTIKIYDILGKEVEVITSKVFSAGTYSIDYDGSKLSSGVYFYKLTSGDFSSTKKMMLVK
ncbi:MAG: T9SS type A sorting domain-containing protein, partial [Ignavibacteriae bacterium]|nr:T9SS type A sorting domain-containing protein [Ignavibacteriota bacterium]